MMQFLLVGAAGYLLGNERARSKVDVFLKSTLSNGLAALQSKKGVNNVSNVAQDSDVNSNPKSAEPIVQEQIG